MSGPQPGDRVPVLVGVKYCGGCNERYDRMGTFRRIITQCAPETRFEAAAGRDEEFDFILILCGCQAQCPDTGRLKSRHGMFSLYQDADPQEAVRRIRAVERMHGYGEAQQ